MHRFRKYLLLPAMVLLLLPAGSTLTSIDSASKNRLVFPDRNDPSHRVAAMITAEGLARLSHDPNGGLCVDLGDKAACFHPDTPQEYVEEWIRRLPTSLLDRQKTNFDVQARWSTTALQASTGVQGDPAIITWGFLPDGINIPSGVGEPAGPSVLHSVFDAHIPSATWKQKIREALAEWEDVSGLTYVEVAYDDGAAFSMSVGIDGVRPDVRIAGHSIDGWGGILAYNSYPDGGDMVIDTDDWRSYDNTGNNYRFLRNVVAHEHGHGIGLGHVIPTDGTKLMEPYASTSFDGVQDDDIRGAMRDYGDWLENNDNPAEATDLGSLGGGVNYTDLSIDKGTTDEDWFLISAPSGGDLNVTISPVGSSYSVGPQGGSTTYINTKEMTDLEINIYDGTGTSLQHTENSTAHGGDEVITAYALIPGDHFIQIRRVTGAENAIQRYTLIATLDVSTSAPIAGDPVPAAAAPSLTIRPNPFNPTTRIVLAGEFGEGRQAQVFDIAGREVRRFDLNSGASGTASIQWDGADRSGRQLPSGVYFVRASGTRGEIVRRALLIR